MADTEYDVTVSVNETINAEVGSTQEEGSSQIGDEVLNLSAESSDDLIVDASISLTEAVDVTAEDSTGGTDDHRKLYYRDANNQHPIAAITGLQTKLDSIDGTLAGHTSSISGAQTTAEGAAAAAALVADDLDDLTGIVGSNTSSISELDGDMTWTQQELNNEIQYRINGNLEVRTITNITDANGIELYSGSNKLQLLGDAIILSRNAKEVAYIVSDSNGGSYFKADNATMATLKMRSASEKGHLAWIADSGCHLSLKKV